jgi:malate dehydrogenase (oxaloacetate-decarboxylating)
VSAGAAGVAITRILNNAGARTILCCDSKGIINRDRLAELNDSKKWLAENTNPDNLGGSVIEATTGADLLIGVSGPDIIPVEAVEKMAKDSIVFALANPDPEIRPEKIQNIARIIATGRSDYPNQINNVLAFPGLFRGALDARATDINEEMKLAAAKAIAEQIDEKDLSEEYIIPSVFSKQVVRRVSRAVKQAAFETNVARRPSS